MTGRCHVCKREVEVRFCKKCDHWFCTPCRISPLSWGVAFFGEVIFGRRPGCCGPEVSHA